MAGAFIYLEMSGKLTISAMQALKPLLGSPIFLFSAWLAVVGEKWHKISREI